MAFLYGKKGDKHEKKIKRNQFCQKEFSAFDGGYVDVWYC